MPSKTDVFLPPTMEKNHRLNYILPTLLRKEENGNFEMKNLKIDLSNKNTLGGKDAEALPSEKKESCGGGAATDSAPNWDPSVSLNKVSIPRGAVKSPFCNCLLHLNMGFNSKRCS